MKIFEHKQVWLVAGSQHLYGADTLKQVDSNARNLAETLDKRPDIPIQLVFKGVVTTPGEILHICIKANSDPACIGLVTWMHTFSPAKMWIRGLGILSKPLCHLHTQFKGQIPWAEIDMDYMNLHQSAHGDREFGHLLSRMGVKHKIIAGHWEHQLLAEKLGYWMRAALGWDKFQNLKIARFGDNMREVAVTEGDKVEAQVRLGLSVNGFGVGDLVEAVESIDDSAVDDLVVLYTDLYTISDEDRTSRSLKDASRIELGLRSFLESGGFEAFTTTFEDLHGLTQLPGISVQRLMHDGYGFGAEGDWKTAGLLRVVKVINEDISEGSSFMEDYTYHFGQERSLVLGAHMLEICPSIASGKPSCEVHPLSIGGKEAPARLVFEVDPGPAVNLSLVDLGHRFRFLANQIEVIKPPYDLPNLPVARALWDPEPNLETSAEAWLYAGGSHHTVFSKALRMEIIEDLAEMAGIELLIIDKNTEIRDFREKLRWNEACY